MLLQVDLLELGLCSLSTLSTLQEQDWQLILDQEEVVNSLD